MLAGGGAGFGTGVAAGAGFDVVGAGFGTGVAAGAGFRTGGCAGVDVANENAGGFAVGVSGTLDFPGILTRPGLAAPAALKSSAGFVIRLIPFIRLMT